jgi:hypothetical protein
MYNINRRINCYHTTCLVLVVLEARCCMDILGPLGVLRFRRGRFKRGRADLGETGVGGGDIC